MKARLFWRSCFHPVTVELREHAGPGVRVLRGALAAERWEALLGRRFWLWRGTASSSTPSPTWGWSRAWPAPRGLAAAAHSEDRPGIEGRLRTLKTSAAAALAAIGRRLLLGLLGGRSARSWPWLAACWDLSGAQPRTVVLGAAGCYVLAYGAPVVALRWLGLGLGYRWGERFAQELARFTGRSSSGGPRRWPGPGPGMRRHRDILYNVLGLPRPRGRGRGRVGGGWAARAYGLTSGVSTARWAGRNGGRGGGVEMVTKTLAVTTRLGLHARPAAAFVSRRAASRARSSSARARRRSTARASWGSCCSRPSTGRR